MLLEDQCHLEALLISEQSISLEISQGSAISYFNSYYSCFILKPVFIIDISSVLSKCLHTNTFNATTRNLSLGFHKAISSFYLYVTTKELTVIILRNCENAQKFYLQPRTIHAQMHDYNCLSILDTPPYVWEIVIFLRLVMWIAFSSCMFFFRI